MSNQPTWIIGAAMTPFGRHKDRDLIDLGSQDRSVHDSPVLNVHAIADEPRPRRAGEGGIARHGEAGVGHDPGARADIDDFLTVAALDGD